MQILPVLVAIAIHYAVAAAQDVSLVTQRRLSTIVGATTGASSIPTLLSGLTPNGQWPDVDYTAGCAAPKANWGATRHWQHILTLASAWHGGLKGADQYVQQPQVRAAISAAMGYWFANDFANAACLDSGGTDACPCGTPGLWNTNWFPNVIGAPTFVGEVCLLLGSSLSSSEQTGCLKMPGRSFGTFVTGINGVSSITGANALDLASIGVDLGLSTGNVTLLDDAFERIHAEAVIQNGIKVDGIRADGSFGQHSGIIYNGNYGKDYLNDLLDLEIEVAGTQYQAQSVARTAVETLVDGNQWMIYRNIFTNVLHWDFSVLGRLMTDPVIDNHSSANIKTNLTQLQVLGEKWGSQKIIDAFNNLSLNTSTANSGNINGNRMFYANDFMVHRGAGYVTTLRMYSKRTQNTECTTGANPFGFHLSDGTVYNHLNGDEYEDIVAAWDWNLIPGITVDYAATPLVCETARKTGTQPLVGGASDGRVGVAAMRYETPTTKTLNWRKTWFFLEDDVQFVMVARIISTTPAPVFSVLDQRKHTGDVLVNGAAANTGNFSRPNTLWHGGVGYAFNTSDPVTLSLSVGSRTGAWSDIGASPQPPVTVDMFVAWLSHDDPAAAISYAVYPATTPDSFAAKVAASKLVNIRNDGSISALLDVSKSTAFLVYWVAAGGKVTIPSTTTGIASVAVQSDGNANVIVRTDTWTVTAADPTQSLATLTLTFTLTGSGKAPQGWGSSKSKVLTLTLPSGGLVGNSVTQPLPA